MTLPSQPIHFEFTIKWGVRQGPQSTISRLFVGPTAHLLPFLRIHLRPPTSANPTSHYFLGQLPTPHQILGPTSHLPISATPPLKLWKWWYDKWRHCLGKWDITGQNNIATWCPVVWVHNRPIAAQTTARTIRNRRVKPTMEYLMG